MLIAHYMGNQHKTQKRREHLAPATFVHIKRKVCKSCVNSTIQNRKTIVAQALLAFPYDIAMAHEKYFYHVFIPLYKSL